MPPKSSRARARGKSHPDRVPAKARPRATPLNLSISLLSLPELTFWRHAFVIVFLVAVVFGQSVGFDFVNFDDDQYVYQNPRLEVGLTPQTVWSIFTETRSGNWHPITWLSHLVDRQMYGLNPWGHHLTNVILHSIAACLLLRWLVLLGTEPGLALFMAAVFAVHPLRVESVAWISERKDLLSGIFFFLTLLTYTQAMRLPEGSKARKTLMLQTAFIQGLGLMSKPMLVTLPGVLLLLDYAVFKNLTKSSWITRLKEKWILVVLSILSCLMTLMAQKGAMESWEILPWELRCANAVLAIVEYLRLFIMPIGLAALYPLQYQFPSFPHLALACLILGGVTVVAVFRRQRDPVFFSGWFWYLGMLIPVLGLVQVGVQSHADRYTYLPQVGLLWGLVHIFRTVVVRLPKLPFLWPIGATAVVLTLGLASFQQTKIWRNSETLWQATLARTGGNLTAEYNLGTYYYEKGDYARARIYLERSLKHDQTNGLYRHLRAQACNNLGNIEARQGRVAEAIALFSLSVASNPQNAEAWNNLGGAYQLRGANAEAYPCFEKAALLEPNNPTYLLSLAYYLAASPVDHVRDGARAVRLAEQSIRLLTNQGITDAGLVTLAAAYAETNRFDEAVQVLDQALAKGMRSPQNGALLQQYRDLFRQRLKLRDAKLTPTPLR